MDNYLKTLNDNDDEANTMQEAASNLQHKCQELIADDKEMHSKACKGIVGYNNLFLQTVSLSFLFCDMIWLNYGFMVDKVNRKKIETM